MDEKGTKVFDASYDAWGQADGYAQHHWACTVVAWGMRCIKSGLGLFHEFSKLQNRTVQFGNNPNQVHHTFRHVDDMGLNRNMVRSSVINDLKRISNIPVGKPVNRIINVSGDKLQYTVFKRLENGEYIYNIGRIHGI